MRAIHRHYFPSAIRDAPLCRPNSQRLLLDHQFRVQKPIGRLSDLEALLILTRISMRGRFDDYRKRAAVEVEGSVEIVSVLWRVSRIRFNGRVARCLQSCRAKAV